MSETTETVPGRAVGPAASLELWFRVLRLYTDYTELLDEKRLTEWLGLFEDDCRYTAISRENADAGLPLAMMRCEGVPGLADRVNAIENVSVYAPRTMRHLFSGLRAHHTAEPDLLSVEGSFIVAQSLSEEHTEVYASGRYRDLVRDDGATLRFAEKTAVYDGALVKNAMVYPL
ncbi:3-phenylpropionate/cinnamic acid dioxygenase small subunit [Actinoalloteichus hoggarensis]|uniref:Anthranilate 1,2-dioxygenase small subunit n=1 Tax=Actinoalloteichus hoggarensis TaxID=1470176 RepID=A0A221W2V5_9PSEU|nr:aromatic-ring-hydroxylating dioxygenase subunit beta [Actinoalloteichus hoggarensis]ASO20043.1 Anthranilate 1,2-dioxygenase small subunit [Actinoalloteichus hoggarensis]MBB5919246.1 3-phenylpropionate/cinnamic acid dioxygenase small subunit [Actinoalloteichus hoggarensis]